MEILQKGTIAKEVQRNLSSYKLQWEAGLQHELSWLNMGLLLTQSSVAEQRLIPLMPQPYGH